VYIGVGLAATGCKKQTKRNRDKQTEEGRWFQITDAAIWN